MYSILYTQATYIHICKFLRLVKELGSNYNRLLTVGKCLKNNFELIEEFVNCFFHLIYPDFLGFSEKFDK